MTYEIALGADAEPLVKDSRLEPIFYQFQRYTDFPDGTRFVTFVQEPNIKEKRRLAVFMVISAHPRQNKRAITPKDLITMSSMPYEKWREMERQHRHYAGLADPLRPVFAGILRRHLQHYNNLKELI